MGGVTAGLTGEPTLELPAMREVRTPGHARVLAWLVVGLAMLAGLVLLVPWQQTARATGKVTALDPNERQQVLDAPVEGRVARVHVTEGQRVEEGDLLLELTDNDPLVLERLDAEQQAFAQRVASARSAVLELEGRILDLQEARIRAVSAAEARVTSARDRARAAAERIPEAQAQLDRDEAQLTRREAGLREGVVSVRDVEVARADAERSRAQLIQAQAGARSAEAEITAAEQDLARLRADADANVGSARNARDAAELVEQSAVADLARAETRTARQATMAVRAPRSGRVLRLYANPGGQLLKPGDPLIGFVPDADLRAVELMVDGRDVAFVREGAVARLQFEGWPALQFAGHPDAASGTFGGRVVLVDAATQDGAGAFRVLVVPDPDQPPWPSGDLLRQGNRAAGWIALGEAPLGFELWRLVNGFPPTPPSEGGKGGDPELGVKRGGKK